MRTHWRYSTLSLLRHHHFTTCKLSLWSSERRRRRKIQSKEEEKSKGKNKMKSTEERRTHRFTIVGSKLNVFVMFILVFNVFRCKSVFWIDSICSSFLAVFLILRWRGICRRLSIGVRCRRRNGSARWKRETIRRKFIWGSFFSKEKKTNRCQQSFSRVSYAPLHLRVRARAAYEGNEGRQ